MTKPFIKPRQLILKDTGVNELMCYLPYVEQTTLVINIADSAISQLEVLGLCLPNKEMKESHQFCACLFRSCLYNVLHIHTVRSDGLSLPQCLLGYGGCAPLLSPPSH